MTDYELLQAYADSGDEGAFRELVDRYVGMVFHGALRKTGDRALAEEIIQNVFTALARKARSIKADVILASWLHRATSLECAANLRKESRRVQKMKELAEKSEPHAFTSEPSSLADVAPLLDDAVNRLPALERKIVLLRFFQDLSLREIAKKLGRSESGIRKGLSRALGQLGGDLKRKDVVISATALAAALTQEFSKAAPKGIGRSVSNAALAAAAKSTLPLTNIFPSIVVMNINVALISAGVAVFLLAAGSGYLVGKHHVSYSEASHSPSSSSATPTSREDQHKVISNGKALAPQIESVAEILRMAATLFRKADADSAAANEGNQLLARLSQEDIQEALAYLDTLEDEPRVQTLMAKGVFAIWAYGHAREAIEYASHQLLGTLRDDVLVQTVRVWANQEPENAFAWSRQATKSSKLPRDRARALASDVLKIWITQNTEDAFDVFVSLPYDDQRAMLKPVFTNTASNEVLREHLIERVAEVGDEILKAQLVEEIGEDWARFDPIAATNWFDSVSFENDETAFQAAAEIGEEWFEAEPIRAVDWLWRHSPESQKDRFVTELIGQALASKDLDAARTWLEQHGYDPANILTPVNERP